MGWTIYWQLRRSSACTADERTAIAKHVAENRGRRWPEPYDLWLAPAATEGQIACGVMKLRGHDVETAEALLAVLRELERVVDGVSTTVSDDLGLIGWEEDTGTWQLGAPRPTDDNATVLGDIRSEWTRASRLAPRPARASGDSAEALLAAYDALDLDDAFHPALLRELEEVDAAELALAGIARYRTGLSVHARRAVEAALKRTTDISRVRGPLLALWRQPGEDPYWHKDLVGWCSAVAGDALLASAFRAELSGPPPSWGEPRLEAVADVLGSTGWNASGLAICAWLERSRRAPEEFRSKWRFVRRHLVDALARFAQPPSFATLVLEVFDDQDDYCLPLGRVMRGFVEAGRARAIPYLRRLLIVGREVSAVVHALQFEHAWDSAPVSAVLPYLLGLVLYPRAGVRRDAVVGLVRRLGAEGVRYLVAVGPSLVDEGYTLPGVDVACELVAYARSHGEGVCAPAMPDDLNNLEGWKDWLAMRGMKPIEVSPIPPAEDRLLYRDALAREDAARALHAARDPSNLLMLARWETLHRELGRRARIMVSTPSWEKWWQGIVPTPVLSASGSTAFYHWVEANANRISKQRVPPLFSEMGALSARELAERLEPLRVVLSGEERDELLEEERTGLAGWPT